MVSSLATSVGSATCQSPRRSAASCARGITYRPNVGCAAWVLGLTFPGGGLGVWLPGGPGALRCTGGRPSAAPLHESNGGAQRRRYADALRRPPE
jgi:hypothetical protein